MNCRIVFMGSPKFATPTLLALNREFEVVGVFTQPDKPTGRGKLLTPTPVKITAKESGIPCFEPENLNNPIVLKLLRELNPDLIVVVAYGKFLPRDILDLPPMGCLNLHASLLPRHRGPSPIPACIMSGDLQTGNTVMLMDEGMDTGPVLSQNGITIGPSDTSEDIHDKLMELGAPLMVATIDSLINGKLIPFPQDETKASYSRLVKKSDGLLDWSLESFDLERLVRAMNPWPGAFFIMGRDHVRVWRAQTCSGIAEPGVIAKITSEGIAVGAGQGLLVLMDVQAPSRKRMSGSEFARGRRLQTGARLV